LENNSFFTFGSLEVPAALLEKQLICNVINLNWKDSWNREPN